MFKFKNQLIKALGAESKKMEKRRQSMLRCKLYVRGLIIFVVGVISFCIPRPVDATPIPCPGYSHHSWSDGTATWVVDTLNPDGHWVLTDAVETCRWSDPCLGLSGPTSENPDDVQSVAYSFVNETIIKPDPNDESTWYYQATFSASSSCDGDDSVIVGTRDYKGCDECSDCGCTFVDVDEAPDTP